MKRVLVTGGAGFLGPHLCRALLARGDEVLCVDNYSTGRRDNIALLLGNKNFEAIRHDVSLPLYVEVDQIYNLACPASPIHYQADPVRTVKTIVVGAINMLGLAKRTGAKILQASTSEVYGDPQVHPQYESYWGNVNPIGQRACYDEGKRCAETLFFDYFRQYGTRIEVARIFNTYGPGMAVGDGRVVSNFIVQALRGDPLTVYGDGSQTRSFCYVDDTVAGLIALMESKTGIGDHGLPVNIGNSCEVTVGDLAGMVLELTGSKSKINYNSLPPDDPARRLPDTARARGLLGWEATVSLRDGLERTAGYFGTRLKTEEIAKAAGAEAARFRKVCELLHP